MKRKQFTFIDLFAGIGGTRIGFENAGFKCVFSSEWDKYCKITYDNYFKEIPHGDITKIEGKDIPKHDILVAGFPCQPFSSIGKREGFKHPTQGTLFHDIVKILKHHNTPSFLLENVQGLVNHDNKRTFKIISDTLEKELKYRIYTKVLDSSNFGVPQIRKRIYIVGFRKHKIPIKKGDFRFPSGTNKRVPINKYLEKNVKGYEITKHLQKRYIFKKNDGKPEVVDLNTKKPVKTLVSTYHKIQRLTGTFVKEGPTGLRLLTEKECKAIMGFPSNFTFPVSRTQMYKQLGNSVVIPVIYEIAKEMQKLMRQSMK